jgi:phage shock protein PspC (stress-responsive transcriptional regulator)
MARRLVRKNGIIAGVCGGIADSFGWDATLVRVLYVTISVLSVAVPGLLIYVILWLLVPAEE